MKIIISPAKKMNENTNLLPYGSLPVFIDKTGKLLEELRSMSYDELKNMWKCSDAIAELNFERIRNMELTKQLTPAIIAYEGIQYQYMAPSVFTEEEYRYAEEHLRILSGFYGVLKPFDGVRAYRLEMQQSLRTDRVNSLYDFWGSSLSEEVYRDNDCIVNLASDEYSRCVREYVPEGKRFITCVFGELKDGRVKEKGTKVKMARGEMVRFMAENTIKNPDDMKSFDRLNYRYSSEHSKGDTFVYIEEE